MYTIILFYILLAVKISLGDECPVQLCNGTYPSTNVVENFCQSWKGVMEERCCIVNDTLIGLDFRSCQIKKLNISGYNFSNVIIMDLRDNALENITSNLRGLTALNGLYLPPQVLCPGGNGSWNNITFEENGTTCQNQINPCLALNISCTENGQCLHTGPGTATCICKAGHHGYKCLQEGEFPTTVFQLSLLGTTLVASLILWFTIGRDIYKSIHIN